VRSASSVRGWQSQISLVSLTQHEEGSSGWSDRYENGGNLPRAVGVSPAQRHLTENNNVVRAPLLPWSTVA
jgi:hypothetical protein